MIHLDTSYLVAAVIPQSTEYLQLQAWLSAGEGVGLSSIAWAEFLCGPLTLDAASAARVLIPSPEPFLARDAEEAAVLFNATGRRKGTLADCMIAATAIGQGAFLATKNLSDFRPFAQFGLRLT